MASQMCRQCAWYGPVLFVSLTDQESVKARLLNTT